jgi:hypothetical protein
MYAVRFCQLPPPLFEVYSRTEYVPVVNVVTGCWRSDDFVSFAYQYQSQFVGVFVLESVNWTESGEVPEVGFAVNPVTGASTDSGVTVMYAVRFCQLPPPLFEVYNRTEYVPVVNVVTGCWRSDDFVSFAYQYQSQFVGVLVLVSVNPTANGEVPEVGFAVNPVTGAVSSPGRV